MLELIDISAAQAFDLPWPELMVGDAAQGINPIVGAWIRTGEGLHDEDHWFSRHAKGCRSANGRVGPYHVLAPSSGNPEGQAAQHFRLAGGAVTGSLPPICDIERNKPLSAEESPAWVECLRRYLTRADQLFGRFVWIYTGLDFLRQLRSSGHMADPFWTARIVNPTWVDYRGLWIAAYPGAAHPDPAKGPHLVAPFVKWDGWQFTNKAPLPGKRPATILPQFWATDRTYFNGNESDLVGVCGGAPADAQDAPPYSSAPTVDSDAPTTVCLPPDDTDPNGGGGTVV